MPRPLSTRVLLTPVERLRVLPRCILSPLPSRLHSALPPPVPLPSTPLTPSVPYHPSRCVSRRVAPPFSPVVRKTGLEQAGSLLGRPWPTSPRGRRHGEGCRRCTRARGGALDSCEVSCGEGRRPALAPMAARAQIQVGARRAVVARGCALGAAGVAVVLERRPGRGKGG